MQRSGDGLDPVSGDGMDSAWLGRPGLIVTRARGPCVTIGTGNFDLMDFSVGE